MLGYLKNETKLKKVPTKKGDFKNFVKKVTILATVSSSLDEPSICSHSEQFLVRTSVDNSYRCYITVRIRMSEHLFALQCMPSNVIFTQRYQHFRKLETQTSFRFLHTEEHELICVRYMCWCAHG